MMNIHGLILLAAILCALFSDQIDIAVKGDRKVRKILIVTCIGVLLIYAIAIAAMIFSKRI